MKRYIRSAYSRFEKQFLSEIIKYVAEKTITVIDELLQDDESDLEDESASKAVVAIKLAVPQVKKTINL